MQLSVMGIYWSISGNCKHFISSKNTPNICFLRKSKKKQTRDEQNREGTTYSYIIGHYYIKCQVYVLPPFQNGCAICFRGKNRGLPKNISPGSSGGDDGKFMVKIAMKINPRGPQGYFGASLFCLLWITTLQVHEPRLHQQSQMFVLFREYDACR